MKSLINIASRILMISRMVKILSCCWFGKDFLFSLHTLKYKSNKIKLKYTEEGSTQILQNVHVEDLTWLTKNSASGWVPHRYHLHISNNFNKEIKNKENIWLWNIINLKHWMLLLSWLMIYLRSEIIAHSMRIIN